MQAALLHPTVAVGDSSLPSGCFGKTGINSGQLFGWELIMTFLLVMTVYAVASESCTVVPKEVFRRLDLPRRRFGFCSNEADVHLAGIAVRRVEAIIMSVTIGL